jgi:hypothetical protein
MEWPEELGPETVLELQCIESMLLDKIEARPLICEGLPGVELHLRMTPNSGQDAAREFVRATLVLRVRPDGAQPSVRVCNAKGLDDVQLRTLERMMSDLASSAGREALLMGIITAFQDALDEFNTRIGDCPVCLDELCVASADVVRTACFHRLHTGCLGAHWLHSLVAQIEEDTSLGRARRTAAEWSVASIVCPVCRSTLAPADLAALCGTAHVMSVRAAADAALLAHRQAEAEDGNTERYRPPDPHAAHSAGFEVISNRIGHATDGASDSTNAAFHARRRGAALTGHEYAVVVSNLRCSDEAACHTALGALAAQHGAIAHSVLGALLNGTAIAEVYFSTARAAEAAAAALNGRPCGEAVVWASVRRLFDEASVATGHGAQGIADAAPPSATPKSRGGGANTSHTRGHRATQQPLCRYYASGACNAGEDCRFRHQRVSLRPEHADGVSRRSEPTGSSGQRRPANSRRSDREGPAESAADSHAAATPAAAAVEAAAPAKQKLTRGACRATGAPH